MTPVRFSGCVTLCASPRERPQPVAYEGYVPHTTGAAATQMSSQAALQPVHVSMSQDMVMIVARQFIASAAVISNLYKLPMSPWPYGTGESALPWQPLLHTSHSNSQPHMPHRSARAPGRVRVIGQPRNSVFVRRARVVRSHYRIRNGARHFVAVRHDPQQRTRWQWGLTAATESVGRMGVAVDAAAAVSAARNRVDRRGVHLSKRGVAVSVGRRGGREASGSRC